MVITVTPEVGKKILREFGEGGMYLTAGRPLDPLRG